LVVLLFIPFIILIGFPLIPFYPNTPAKGAFIFVNNFNNLSLTITGGLNTNIPGVTTLLWGPWDACYSSGGSNYTCTTLDWISNSYNFTIADLAGSGNAMINVDKTWINILFLQFVGALLGIFTWIITILLLLCRKNKLDRTQNLANDLTRKRLKSDLKRSKSVFLLVSLLFVWITIIVFGNIYAITKIDAQMQRLGTGHSSITTKPGSGYIMTLIAYAVLFVIFIIVGLATWRLSKRQPPPEVTLGVQLQVTMPVK